MSETYHFIGIGGIGMSALARILLSKKIEVSGSDIAANYITENLAEEGATIKHGQSASHILPKMNVVYSSDIKNDNPEYQAALQLNCRLLHRSDLLAQLSKDYCSLAVSGTHGKTTTSSLLATVLVEAGTDPSFCIGGVLKQFHSNSRAGQGKYFAFEADESDGTFLKYSPFGSIVTNIDNDHLNHFNGSMDVLIEAFRKFMTQTESPKHLFWCGDDSELLKLNMPGNSYGFGTHCAWKASGFKQRGFSSVFDIDCKGHHYPAVEVALTGKHNALNALAVFGLCINLGIDEESIRRGLRGFSGVMRRCQQKGQIQGITLIDDYAHHPTEIRATLGALRQAIGENRLIAVFQPHRYSRTQDCLGTFGDIFDSADEVIVTDIYASGEESIKGVSSDVIVNEIMNHGLHKCSYSPRSNLVEKLAEIVRPHDVVVTLGAGDITKVADELSGFLKLQTPKKLKVGLISGGRSTEHDISLVSAGNVFQALRNDIYDVEEFGITKKGEWVPGKNIRDLLGKQEDRPVLTMEVIQKLLECDVLIPILHGPYGEDGTIQGFFDMLGKAYVGCNHRSAAICMNKVYTKQLASFKGLNVSPSIDFTEFEWKQNPEIIKEKIIEELLFPVFVKPAHLGSSIGVSKVVDPSELDQAIAKALEVDHHILIENGICHCREIEFAVLGNDDVKVFPPGEVLTGGRVYDFEAKYSSDGIGTTSCAVLSKELIEEGMALAEKAYKAVGCTGLARVDFFLDEEEKFWLNEINPIPGFTAISLYPQICAHHGLKTEELMDRLIVLALHRKRHEKG